MKTEKSIEVLNTLIQAHNDRIEGYETAIKEADEAFLQEADLKVLFNQFIQTSKHCKNMLANEVMKLGGVPAQGTNLGKLFRTWMDVKYALTCNDRYTILKSCEHGEGIAQEIYGKIIVDYIEHLSHQHQKLVHEQHQLIKNDHEKVIDLFNNSLKHE